MNKVLQRVETSLRSFYIFNSIYGRTEGEEKKKILYYYPSDIELNTKIKDVGLSEAIISFSNSFSEETSKGRCKALHTQKTTQVFYEPEPDYWMALVLNVPKDIRLKDGIEVTDYRGADVHDKIYRAIVEQCYNMYRLFHGRFHVTSMAQANPQLPTEEYDQLKERLALFYDKYIVSLRLPACDIIDVTRSIQYLPLDKSLFLWSHNFVNMVCSTFPIISEALFLYKDQVVCSGKINPQDLFTLHEYILSTGSGTGTTKTDSGSGASSSTQSPLVRSASMEAYRNGAFVTGSQGKDLPQVFLLNGSTNELDSYYLIMYRALNATLCLFATTCSPRPDQEFYDELHSYMGPQLSSLAREIQQSCGGVGQVNGKTTSPQTVVSGDTDKDPATPKYLFVNEQSLKHTSNIVTDKRLPKSAQGLPMNVVHVMADLFKDHEEVALEGPAINGLAISTIEEMQVKTTDDFWIIKRRCNWSQYFVVIFNSKATLLDVTLEARRIFEQELTDDVFFDK